jgi:hypothetical protein
MDEKRFVELIELTIRADIPLEDLKLRQKVKLAGLTFTLCDGICKVSRKKLRILIPRSMVVSSPEHTVEEVMVIVVRFLFPKFNRFEATRLAHDWLQNPPQLR